MAQKPVDDHLLRQTLDAAEMCENFTEAANSLGLNYNTFRSRLRIARQKFGNNGPKQTFVDIGYDVDRPDRTPQEAWAAHADAVERKLTDSFRKSEMVIPRRNSDPFVIFHATDPHVDDDSTPLRLLEADIKSAHDLGAIMCHGGDLLNNWPLAGRLAKKWAEQECTLSDGLLRARHYIDIFKPDVWVDGNHEEMNPYLSDLFGQWLPEGVLRDYWMARFTILVPGGRDCRVALTHKFGKGGSWFHRLHGHIREMLEAEEVDLLLDGHLHSDGVLDHTLPERQHASLAVASAGYKVLDKFATRISKGGKTPKLRGRAHWIVVDPSADYEENLCVAFKSARQAEAYINGLANLSEV